MTTVKILKNGLTIEDELWLELHEQLEEEGVIFKEWLLEQIQCYLYPSCRLKDKPAPTYNKVLTSTDIALTELLIKHLEDKYKPKVTSNYISDYGLWSDITYTLLPIIDTPQSKYYQTNYNSTEAEQYITLKLFGNF